jgi:hypothetical protein
MSRWEKILWGVDFMIAAIGYSLGGPFAGLVCFLLGGTLVLAGLIKTDKAQTESPTPGVSIWTRNILYCLGCGGYLALILGVRRGKLTACSRARRTTSRG